jgi:ankyrin repeat protein
MLWATDQKTETSLAELRDQLSKHAEIMKAVSPSFALSKFKAIRETWGIAAEAPSLGSQNEIIEQLMTKCIKEINTPGYNGCQIQTLWDCLHVQTLWPDGFKGHVIARIAPELYCGWWEGIIPSGLPIIDIHAIARRGEKNELRNALQNNPFRINEFDNYGDTPLHCAVSEGHEGAIVLLIEQGADVNAKNDQPAKGETPLGRVVLNACFDPSDMGMQNIIHVLLRSGANPNICENSGLSPAFVPACINADVLDILICNGVDVNHPDNKGQTPLHGAAQNANLKAISLLLQHGANVNAETKDGETPLDLAMNSTEKDQTEVCNILRTNGGVQKKTQSI